MGRIQAWDIKITPYSRLLVKYLQAARSPPVRRFSDLRGNKNEKNKQIDYTTQLNTSKT